MRTVTYGTWGILPNTCPQTEFIDRLFARTGVREAEAPRARTDCCAVNRLRPAWRGSTLDRPARSGPHAETGSAKAAMVETVSVDGPSLHQEKRGREVR
ncbi:hypothetical protein GCM10010193_02620 [Kitasatospora atroaurantiaca]